VGHASNLIALALACAAPVASAGSPLDARPVLDEVDPFWPGVVDLRVAAEVGESSSLVIDGWYHVNERFRLGLTSSTDARRQLGAGRGLCIRACPVGTLAGATADAEVRLSPTFVGRAALDATRFAPTAVAVELGFDAIHKSGAWFAEVSPVLRLGIARRDLDNADTAAVLGQLRARVWCTGGAALASRVALSLDALRDTPSLGVALGVWQELDRFTLSARFGASEVARVTTHDVVFAEVAIAWAI
jgi:hypothetical protein